MFFACAIFDAISLYDLFKILFISSSKLSIFVNVEFKKSFVKVLFLKYKIFKFFSKV